MTSRSAAQRPAPSPSRGRAGSAAVPLTITGAIALSLASDEGRPVLAVTVLAVQLALLAGWFVALDLRRVLPAQLAAVAAVAAVDVVVLRAPLDPIPVVAGVLGLVPLAGVVAQLASRDRSRMTTVLSATVAAVTCSAGVAASLALHAREAGAWALSVAFAAAAVAAAPLLFAGRLPLAVLLGLMCVPPVLVGGLLAAGTAVSWPVGAALGGVTGLATAAVASALGRGLRSTDGRAQFAERDRPQGAAVVLLRAALPLSLAAPLAYAVSLAMA